VGNTLVFIYKQLDGTRFNDPGLQQKPLNRVLGGAFQMPETVTTQDSRRNAWFGSPLHIVGRLFGNPDEPLHLTTGVFDMS